MFNNFFNFFRLCAGFKLFLFLMVLMLMIITFYQMLITLFAPCFGEFLEKGKISKFSLNIDKRIKTWNKRYSDSELEIMINSIFNVFESNNIKSFRELKKLKLNQILGMINEINDIDDETKKLYGDTIRDLIWINNKK
jgi:hypothetical protein